jgi:hypothetical protein
MPLLCFSDPFCLGAVNKAKRSSALLTA